MENSSEESTHEKRLITLNAEVVRRGWCAGLHRTAGATRGLSAEQRPMLLDALDAEAARLAQVVGLSKSPFSLLPNHPLLRSAQIVVEHVSTASAASIASTSAGLAVKTGRD